MQVLVCHVFLTRLYRRCHSILVTSPLSVSMYHTRFILIAFTSHFVLLRTVPTFWFESVVQLCADLLITVIFYFKTSMVLPVAIFFLKELVSKCKLYFALHSSSSIGIAKMVAAKCSAWIQIQILVNLRCWWKNIYYVSLYEFVLFLSLWWWSFVCNIFSSSAS